MLQTVYIEDIGSMHGTYVEKRKVIPKRREKLFSGDYIKFGAEVTRGPGTCWINDEPAPYCCFQPIRWLPLSAKVDFFDALSESNPLPESFPPLEMCISFDWVENLYVTPPHQSTVINRFRSPLSMPNAPTMSHAEIPRNSFSVPDYDDDEDDEVEITHESIRSRSVEIVDPPPYTISESELSCAGSFTSDDYSSEPPTPSPKICRLVLPKPKRLPEMLEASFAQGVSTSARDRQAALSDAPSAARFFHSEGEQSSVQSQTVGRPKPPSEHEPGPTKTVIVYASENDLYDGDVTESDIQSVGSEDGHSDDLFDDDVESIQQGSRAESPVPSDVDDSDDEPLASNRGTKLGRANHLQELEHWIMDKDEPSCPPPPERQSDMSPEYHHSTSGVVYSSDSIFDQRDILQRDIFQNALTNTNDARAPSPSDAAMAKRPITPLPHQDDSRSPVRALPPFVVPMTSDFSRPDTLPSQCTRPAWSAWPGYPVDMVEYGGRSYSPIFSTRCNYQDGPFGYQPSGNPTNVDDSSDRSEEDISTFQAPVPFKFPEQPVCTPWLPVPPSTTTTALEEGQNVRSSATTSSRATKLSIDDIVEKKSQEASVQDGGQNLKRKADDISTCEYCVEQDLALGDAEVVPELGIQVTVPDQSVTSETVAPPSTAAEIIAQSQIIEAMGQPARKRAKTHVGKYAAAVFAGMVAGGVGTMAALLALPPIQLG